MLITYPEAVRWEKSVSGDIVTDFGKNNAARLRSSLPKLDNMGISADIADLSTSHITWFEPWYQSTIGAKTNPKLSSIFETTLGKAATYPYKILTIRESDRVVGSIIFSLRKNRVSIAYRVFNPTWNETNLQSGPALIGEYYINQFCIQSGLNRLSHGKDRNPYGLNANIGLALFKLSVGCHATLPTGVTTIHTINTSNLTTDALIMEHPKIGTNITHAYLIGTPDVLEKYTALKKYHDILTIHCIERVDAEQTED